MRAAASSSGSSEAAPDAEGSEATCYNRVQNWCRAVHRPSRCSAPESRRTTAGRPSRNTDNTPSSHNLTHEIDCTALRRWARPWIYCSRSPVLCATRAHPPAVQRHPRRPDLTASKASPRRTARPPHAERARQRVRETGPRTRSTHRRPKGAAGNGQSELRKDFSGVLLCSYTALHARAAPVLRRLYC